MEDDGFCLYETQAILRYIDRLRPVPGLVPQDIRADARMNQMMGISDDHVFPNATRPLSFNRLMAPRMGLLVDEDGPFLVSDTLTLADILLFPNVDALARTPEGQAVMPHHSGLGDWVAAMRTLPSRIASIKPPLRATA